MKMKQTIIFPIQPAFINQGMDYQEHFIEWNPLTKNKAVLFQFQVSKDREMPFYLVPDGCIELLFCCDHQNLDVLFFGKRTHAREVELIPEKTYFGFRPFYEAGFRLPTDSYLDYMDEVISLIDLPELEYLACALTQKKTFQERCNLFLTSYVSNLFLNTDQQFDFVIECSRRICVSCGKIEVSDLGEMIGYSNRHLRRSYKNIFGISPTFYRKIIRFQYSIHLMQQAQNLDQITHYTNISMECGYYDQSYMNNDYRQLTGKTPKEVSKKLLCYI